MLWQDLQGQLKAHRFQSEQLFDFYIEISHLLSFPCLLSAELRRVAPWLLPTPTPDMLLLQKIIRLQLHRPQLSRCVTTWELQLLCSALWCSCNHSIINYGRI